MIDFDVTQRPLRPGDWVKLLGAIHGALKTDEASWLEWKSRYDWSNRDHLAKLSRAVLAMANRDPEEAREYLEGSGVIVVGLEPGVILGVEAIDPADIENKLRRFLGGTEGPRWDARWLRYEERDVLVIEVSAPRPGDPPYVLQDSTSDLKKGQTFVRAGAASVAADQSQMIRLAQRFNKPVAPQTLDLDVGVASTASFPTYFWEQADVENLVASERRILMDAFARFVPESQPVGFKSAFQIAGLGKLPENRTLEQYEAQVDRYLQDVQRELPEILLEVGASVIHPPVFTATNLGSRNYKDVQISMRVEGDAHALSSSDDKKLLRYRLPQRPRFYGPRDNPALQIQIPNYAQSLPYIPSLQSSYTRRDIRNGGSFEVDAEEFDLRPHESHVIVEDDVVFLVPRVRQGTIEVAWKATASNVDALANGTMILKFDGPAIDLLRLAQNEEGPPEALVGSRP